MTHTTRSPSPQIEVIADGRYAEVRVNGVKLENVKRVSVSNDMDVDDVVRSSITIDLVGEPVLMGTTPAE